MFNYFGSKYTLASTYQPPRHATIIEPFAGSAQYSMFWMRERSDITCILYDTDPKVIASWQRMMNATPSEIMSWTIQVGDPIRDYVDLANYGGGNLIANERIVQRFNQSKPRWARTRAYTDGRIVVHEGDYTDAPDIDATWFIDPPYVDAGHLYDHGTQTMDYASLGVWASSRQGQVIVTEAGTADWLPFRHHRSQGSNLGHTSNRELVWESTPEPTLFD